MKSICFECSLIGKSCCKGTQICLTTGDVRRISQYLAVDSFSTIENPDLAYMDPGDDPGWLTLTLRSDGKRRVLKRTGNQSCMMLGENGCLLPMIVRPLVCRLHPYLFTEAGIAGIDPDCLISREPDWPGVLKQLGMAPGEANNWHKLLYFELHGEYPANSDIDGGARSTESEKKAA